MAERLILPSWLHEPSGGATFDDPSICYQHPDPLTGKPKVSNLPVSGWRCSGNQNPSYGPPQVLPSTQSLYKKLNGKKQPEQERRAGWPGWFVFITCGETTRF